MSVLRVLSYNVHKGFCSANRQFLLKQIRESIRSVDAEVVFLQEVVGENSQHASQIDGWIDEGQFEFLADTVWPHFSYGKNAVYDHGHHGNAILSKYPIVDSENIDVSMYRRSQRGLLLSVIEPGIYVICVHMGLLGWERRQQFKRLEAVIAEKIPADAPLIIAGDFNDWSGSLHSRFKRILNLREASVQANGRLAKTFPAKRPVLRLDRIYFRGFTAVTAKRLSGEPWRSLSDHCALYAELELIK
ncbi:endonuclease/exonuclease/phosphatase family protein [uncultured Zhongshania sp.]|jgi:endonuclease/exonuclease/phosphatase family metal-dependent hydrolase|uniref:endonuclease/exonuclease/phosphatase family protein n=1 Tax=uncultured Zhongshania sp. TaxID=1642288 RepID=UPI0025DF2368|nr:endonuclease/exonuclease/phosphatase family protein [uncultured Zhongshania sp.]|tara:strand:- start:5189 stop:5926 length:738 start_codon:yes stop_codon:yes gene_type:complete